MGKRSEFVWFDSARAGSFDCRTDGVMGYWSDGASQNHHRPTSQHPNTPLLQYSIIPPLQYPITPLPSPPLSSVRACKFWANPNNPAHHTTTIAKAEPMQRGLVFGSRPALRRSFSRRAGRSLSTLLCAALIPAAQATNHLLRMDEIMAALEGDPTIQFIEI